MGSSPDPVKPKTKQLVMVFVAKHTELRRKSKNQNKVSEWCDMSIHGQMWTIKIQLSVLI